MVFGGVDVWGIYLYIVVWICCFYEMSFLWWEGNINLFDWMFVSIVLGGKMLELY